MNILNKIIKSFFNILKFTDNNLKSPEIAYDIWADTYGEENDNLILHYDKIIIKELISKLQIKNKIIFDYGCGTGRNWPLFLDKNPTKIIGCDISQNMLNKLKKNFSHAEVYKTKNLELSFLQNNKFDIIISTLVIAHITDIKKMFSEWNRVIKHNGDIIITDLHPELLRKGGKRTFNLGKELLTVENHCHSIKTIEGILSSFGFKVVNLIEIKIDEKVKHFYENKNVLQVYNNFYNTPFIYGIHLSR